MMCQTSNYEGRKGFLLSSFSKLIFLLIFAFRSCIAYEQNAEGPYLSNFNDIISQSYSAINDVDIAPPSLISQCRGSDPNGPQSLIEVTLVGIQGISLTSTDAAGQCGVGTTCILPAGLSLIMTSSISLGALIIRGNLIWDDSTQSLPDQWLCAGYIAVEKSGMFSMHLESSQKTGWVYIKDNGSLHSSLRSRAFGAISNELSEEPIIDISGYGLMRTWSLLARPFEVGDTHLRLMHNPEWMKWKVGDRIAIAPTGLRSDGTGQTFKISGFQGGNLVELDSAATFSYRANFAVRSGSGQNKIPALQSAEVINLSRNIIITGDDFTNIGCTDGLPESIPGEQTSTMGCKCSSIRNQCTMGLHVIHMHRGVHKIQNTRVESCGQRGVEGKYCLHFHKMESCPDCLLKNNAIENSQQRGIIVHGTHLSKVTQNVLYDVRGAGLYIEDGNEMWNTLDYNVIICPWSLQDSIQRGCTIPGTSNAQSDTILNQSGIYATTPNNHLIGNRVSNSFNGMLIEANNGRGDAFNRVCNNGNHIGRMEGNTFHSHGRFGTYMLANNFPKNIDVNVDNNGFLSDSSSCNGFTASGEDNGFSSAINNHFDYGNAFVGHYNGGDIQHKNHVSVENLNLIYWKESKSFADKCSAFLSGGYYRSGNMALPDQGTIIIEETKFEGDISLEFNHHCNVGVTGVLCFPQYVLHNVDWKVSNGKWVIFQNGNFQGHNANQNHGGILMLSPTSHPSSFFPGEYISLVSNKFDYLLSIGMENAGNQLCDRASSLGLEVRYDGGILCKVPLRALKVYTKNLVQPQPQLHIKIWNHDFITPETSAEPTVEHTIEFHQIGNDGQTDKQGYSFPVISSLDYSYEISLPGNNPIPSEWIIEFSDPVMGNKYNNVDHVRLNFVGRNCGNGLNNFGIISSQHDRKFIWADSEFHLGVNAWGRGACTIYPDEDFVDCNSVPDLEAKSCPSLCSSTCPSNSYCSCDQPNTCVCLPGFIGPQCSESLCASARCAPTGKCSATYLGGTLPVSLQACICDDLHTGPLCDLNPCEGVSCSGNGICKPRGDNDWFCDCDLGFSGDECETTCDGFCGGNGGTYPYGCAIELLGVVTYWCNSNGGCHYSADPDVPGPNGFCAYRTSYNHEECECVATNDCFLQLSCSDDGSCPSPIEREDGTPCNSEANGICINGTCLSTFSPTPNPTASPNENPTASPNENPTASPNENPTASPNENPTTSPYENPTIQPSPTSNNTTCPTLIWVDEFDGHSLHSDWEIMLGDGCEIDLCGWGNNELQTYSSSNVIVSNDILTIEARREDDGVPFTSGRIRTKNKQDFNAQQSGRIEARIRIPTGQGIWPAFWMMPTDDIFGEWPSSGEIDIMENIGNEVSKVHGTIHYGPNYNGRQHQGGSFQLPNNEKFTDDFHVFAIERDDTSSGVGRLRWIIDDYIYITKTSSDISPFTWPFDESFHFILNVAIGGNWPGNPDETTEFPQRMEIDYVKVYDSFLPSLNGPNFVDGSNLEQYEVFNIQNFDGQFLWEVPSDASIISGQGTSFIMINFGKNSGFVKVTLNGATCNYMNKEISVHVLLPQTYVFEQSLENFDSTSFLSLLFNSGNFLDDFSNPSLGGINQSLLVGKYTRNAENQFDVIIYSTSSISDANQYVNEYKKFFIDIYTNNAPVGSSFLIQLESNASIGANYPTGRHSRYSGYTKLQGSWDRIEFDFLDRPDTSVDDAEISKIVILINPNTFTGHTYYLDNLDSYTQTTNPSLPTSSPTTTNTPSPTLSPTPVPTPVPTPSPTSPPTTSPTPVPTFTPTSPPTSLPTSSPTSSPTPPPTPSPTNSPTTASPNTPPTRSPTQPSSDLWLIDNTTVSHQSGFIHISHDINSGPQGAGFEMYESDCTTSLADNEIVYLSSGPILHLSNNITYSLFVDQSKLSSSQIVTFDDSTNSTGSIAFCTKLTTKTSNGREVETKKVIFDISFNMSNVAFSIDNIGVTGNEPESVNLGLLFTATVCECDETFSCVSKTYTQGSTAPVLRVCITPSSPDVSIKNMTLALSNGVINHNAVTYGSNGPSLDGVTFISKSGHKTMVVTRIIAGLYDGSETTSVSVSGSCLLGPRNSNKNKESVSVLFPYKLSIEIQEDAEPERSTLGCFVELFERFFTKHAK